MKAFKSKDGKRLIIAKLEICHHAYGRKFYLITPKGEVFNNADFTEA